MRLSVPCALVLLLGVAGCLEEPGPLAETCTWDGEYDVEVKLQRDPQRGGTQSVDGFATSLYFEEDLVADGRTDYNGCLAFRIFQEGPYEVRAERDDNETCRSEGRAPFQHDGDYPIRPRLVPVGIFAECDG